MKSVSSSREVGEDDLRTVVISFMRYSAGIEQRQNNRERELEQAERHLDGS